MIDLHVPAPVSANNRLYPENRRLVLTPAYRKWLNQAVSEIKAQYGNAAPIDCEVLIIATITPPDRRVRDIDNELKATNDALVNAGVLADDSLIKCQCAYKEKPSKAKAGVKVSIYNLHTSDDSEIGLAVRSVATKLGSEITINACTN